jgi:GT2 family glycosyltransferase
MTSNPSPRLAIVFAHWEDEATSAECLAHLAAASGADDAAWIMVDNGSSDGSASRLQAKYPRVQVIRQERNIGHAAAINAGADAAQVLGCTFMLMLDNDAFVAPDAIPEMLALFGRRPDAGVASPRILSGLRPGLLWYDGGSLSAIGRGSHDHMWRPAASTPKVERTVAFATACAMMVRLDVFRAAGGFDGSLITYADDLDLSIRIRKAGYAIVHVPSAEVTHGESRNVISKGGKEFRDYYNMRNQLIIAWRHGGIAGRSVGVPVAMVAAGLVPAAAHMLLGHPRRSKALMKGMVDFLRGRTGWGNV